MVDKNETEEYDRVDLAGWRRRDEIRRSNASVPHRNKKKYTRKNKYNKLED